MKLRNIKRDLMTWRVMDALALNFDDASFDVVIDKSTLDAILCGDMSFYKTAILLKESQRVMRVDGLYLCISYGSPENRVFHFRREHLGFDISCFVLSMFWKILF